MKKQTTKSAHLIGGLAIVTVASFALAGGFVYLSLANIVDAAPIIIKSPIQLSPVIATAVPKPSTIAVAGLDADTVLGGVSWKNTTSLPIQIRKVYLSVAGGESYAADFAKVGIRKQNGLVAYGVPDPSGNLSIDLSDSPIYLYANTTTQSDLIARFNATVSGGIAGGNWTDVARSGHQPTITVTGFDRVATNGVSTKQSVSGVKTNPVVLRKSHPIVNKLPLASTSLANVDQDLMKWQISAHSAASVAVKQMVFTYSKTSGLQLSNFRLRRGASDVSLTQYSIVDANGSDIQNGSIPGSSQTGYLIVSFVSGQEETISGSGQTYTLHAKVTGASTGASAIFGLYQATPKVITGYLSANGYAAPFAAPNSRIYHIASSKTQAGILSAFGDFVWSDMSEVPHTADTSVNGSKDWTNGTYVQSLNQVSTLSL